MEPKQQLNESQLQKLARLNYESMVEVLKELEVALPYDLADWRPTERVAGYAVGTRLGGIAVATDGLLLLVVVPGTRKTFFLHKEWFSTKVKNLHTAAKPKRPTAAKAATPSKAAKRQRLLDLL
jgi:hypothetical protein